MVKFTFYSSKHKEIGFSLERKRVDLLLGPACRSFTRFGSNLLTQSHFLSILNFLPPIAACTSLKNLTGQSNGSDRVTLTRILSFLLKATRDLIFSKAYWEIVGCWLQLPVCLRRKNFSIELCALITASKRTTLGSSTFGDLCEFSYQISYLNDVIQVLAVWEVGWCLHRRPLANSSGEARLHAINW